MTTLTPLSLRWLYRQRFGIAIYLIPGNADWDIELQRAPDDSGSPGTPDVGAAVTLATLAGPTQVYVDESPEAQTGDVFYYRFRHVGAICGTPGAYTSWTRGVVATNIPNPLPPVPSFDFLRVVPDPEQPTQGVGRMNLNVKDAALRLLSMDYQLKEDTDDWVGPDLTPNTWYTAWDFQNGNFGQDRVIDLYQEVLLNPFHLNGIKWRWTYYDVDGEIVSDTDAFLFDFDTLPNVTFAFGLFGSDAILSWVGDEDTASIKYLVQVNPAPDDAPTEGELDAGGTCVAQQSSDGTVVASGLVEGDKVYIRARGYGAAGCTGQQSDQDFSFRFEVPATGSGVPLVEPSYDQAGGTGQTALSILDPDGVVTGTDFADKIGEQAWESFPTPDEDRVAPFNAAHNTAISEKHNSSVSWRVYYTDPRDATEHFIGQAHTFDVDLIANVLSCDLSINASGQVVASIRCDEDSVNVYITVGVNTTPADPTSGSNDGSAALGSDHAAVITTAVVASYADTVTVKLVADDVDSVLGPILTVEGFRDPGELGELPTMTIEPEAIQTYPSRYEDLRLTAVAPSLGVGPYEVRYRQWLTDGSAPGAFSIWFSSPQTVRVFRDGKWPKYVEGQARDTGGSNVAGPSTIIQVLPSQVAIGPGGGLNPGAPTSPTVPTGGGDPRGTGPTLDGPSGPGTSPGGSGVPGPHIYRVHTTQALGGLTTQVAGSGYSAVPVYDPTGLQELLDTAAMQITSILERPSGDPIVDVLQFIAATGHLLSGIQDSQGREVRKFLAKLLVADPDDLDGLADGTTFGRVDLGSLLASGQTWRGGIDTSADVDDGSALTAPPASYVVSASGPSTQDYPDGCLWLQV